MFKAKKRFIAGAVCPRCNQMDRLVIYSESGKDFRECVNCDFKEELHFPNTPREPDTRVNRSADEKARETQVVKLLDPKKS